jgi:hypothetical protein
MTIPPRTPVPKMTRSIDGLRNRKVIGIERGTSISNASHFNTTLFECRNKPVRAERAPGVAIPTVARMVAS